MHAIARSSFRGLLRRRSMVLVAIDGRGTCAKCACNRTECRRAVRDRRESHEDSSKLPRQSPRPRRTMKLMERRRWVVVGMDFSPGAAQALERAAELATEIGASLACVHAYEDPPGA